MMKMKRKKETLAMKKIMMLFVFALAMMMVQAGNPGKEAQEMFLQGNEAYNAGNFDEALNIYKGVEEAGMESSALYYNMGNTYYKMREYAKSILYYEKALKLEPSNEDIQINLAIANKAIVDKIDVIPQSFFVKGWHNLCALFSPNGWAVVSLLLLGVMLLGLLLYLLSRRIGIRKLGFFAGLICAVLLLLSVLVSIKVQQDMKSQDEAIVMTPTVTVKSSPNESSVDLFVLHEGTKVTLLDVAEGWNKVKIADGSVGWLEASHLEAF